MLGTVLPSRSVGEKIPTEFTKLLFPYAIFFIAASLLLYCLYRQALPKPIPGIPYNEAATKSILGDVASLQEGIARTGAFQIWLHEQAAKHNSPLFQIFIRPFGKPMLILSDFREAQDMLLRRSKEFDRASIVGDMISGAVPNHHIIMKTNSEWKHHRRLLQDLMSPQFLTENAAPTIYSGVLQLIQLWNDKTRIAEGRPFLADSDIYYCALDATTAFSFGANASSATRPTMEFLKGLGADDIRRLQGTTPAGGEEPLHFPDAAIDENLKASLDVAEAIEQLQGSPIPRIKWKFVERQPAVRRAVQIKNAFIREEISKALERTQNSKESKGLSSAVELMVLREKKLADNDGREPDFFSSMMMDEVYGLVVAGHDTTSTTLCWGVKLLGDNPHPQSKLREVLMSAFTDAVAENRNPTIKEITGTKIPYLDAALEEILRCGSAAVLLDREAICDTELLGYRIPKGTVILSAARGQSILKPAIPVDESRRSKSSQNAKARAWDDADIAQFKPERWLVDPQDPSPEFDQQAGPQLAFGFGTRGCYGRRLAYIEMRIIVTMIVWNFQLLPCQQELSSYAPKEGFTYKPKDCYVRLQALR
ncbi:cytochrome P450 [Colletotrichum orchidophilum]|uniref:Cytochrome P450 n=1 Tax=Colletotrichum orchidophilum TaxID=1209926 RepID=A0A1G4AYW1_9PEZI|nr:cytochrome P450 [Colletotrichum orchidophilum]OHE94327.1 cytochrome P450 [Colletotrichum orchidophilum]